MKLQRKSEQYCLATLAHNILLLFSFLILNCYTTVTIINNAVENL